MIPYLPGVQGGGSPLDDFSLSPVTRNSSALFAHPEKEYRDETID